MTYFTVRSAEFFSVKLSYASQHTFAFSCIICLLPASRTPIRIRHAPLWMAVLRYSYPFTPPQVRPPMTYFWHSGNTTVIGTPLKVMLSHGVFDLRWYPHSTPRSVLLKVYLIHGPQMDCFIVGQEVEFFYALLA